MTELLGNAYGLIDLSMLHQNDTISFHITCNNYDTISSINVVKDMFNKVFFLSQKVVRELQGVSVNYVKKNVALKPNEIKYNWSRYMKNMFAPLSATISQLPFITNSSLNPKAISLETIGKKKVKVFLDGRQLSESEILSLPSVSIAKATLITFPNASDSQDDSAILYLTTVNFAYEYAYNEISMGYDVGVRGPSLTYRHTEKKGAWSNNVFINAYDYKFPCSITKRAFNHNVFQIDTALSHSSSLVLSTSITRQGRNGDLLTLGLYGNLSRGRSDNNSFSFVSNDFLKSKMSNDYVGGGLFVHYQWRIKNGNMMKVSGNLNSSPLNNFSFDNIGGADQLSSISKQKEWSSGLSARYTLRSQELGNWKWQQSFDVGFRYKRSSLMRQINDVESMENNIMKEYGLFAGYAMKLSENNYSIDVSLVGNLSENKGYKVDNYQKGYFLPKLSVGYSINDNNDLSFSFSMPTYRPNLSSLVTDSSYSNNWSLTKGNNELKSEHQFKSELLFTSTMNSLSIESSLGTSFFHNGIVNALTLDKPNSYLFISNWKNLNYWIHDISINVNYSWKNGLTISSNNMFSYISFADNSLSNSYRKGFYFNGNLKVGCSKEKLGGLSLMLNWIPIERSYFLYSKRKPSLDFSYSKSISRKVDIFVGIYDILNTEGFRNSFYDNSLNYYQIQKKRSLSLSLTWKIGEMFGVRTAGDNSSNIIISDTKK
ncbi:MULTISPECIES: hypothetical protein [Chitinophagaceae]